MAESCRSTCRNQRARKPRTQFWSLRKLEQQDALGCSVIVVSRVRFSTHERFASGCGFNRWLGYYVMTWYPKKTRQGTLAGSIQRRCAAGRAGAEMMKPQLVAGVPLSANCCGSRGPWSLARFNGFASKAGIYAPGLVNRRSHVRIGSHLSCAEFRRDRP